MAETLGLRLYEPHLKAHRLVPTRKDWVQPERLLRAAGLPKTASKLQGLPSSKEARSLEETQALAAQASVIARETEPLLEGLSPLLERLGVAESATQAVPLLRSILNALPGKLSAGLDASVSQIDWAFLRLLNQPAHPGLIEQILLGLGAPSEGEMPASLPEPPQAKIEALRHLHRRLVSLQQDWDALVDSYLPAAPEPPAAPVRARLPRRPGSLPARGIVLKKRASASAALLPGAAQREKRADALAPHRRKRARAARLRVVVLVALLLLVTSSLGVALLKNVRFPAGSSGTTAASANQPGLVQVAPASAQGPAGSRMSPKTYLRL